MNPLIQFKETTLSLLIVSVFIWPGELRGQVTPVYEVIDLGGLPCDGPSPCLSSEANDINQAGSMAGSVQVPGCFHAALYKDGKWLDLGVLGNPPGQTFGTSYGRALNKLEQVVGMSATSLGAQMYRAFIWQEGASMRDLGALGPFTQCYVANGEQQCFTTYYSDARAINDRGQVVGITSTSAGMRAFIWEESTGMIDLGTLGTPPAAGTAFSEATDINNAGDVIGQSNGHPFIYKDAVMKELDENLPTGSLAVAINNVGDVVVWSRGQTYLLHDGALKVLKPLPGDIIAQAFNLNDLGQAVGESVGCGTESCTIHPVLWDGDNVINIGGIPGAWLNQPNAINDSGAIVGTSNFNTPPYISHGFLAEPH